ncbi:MAG: hypothetical protein ACI841_002472 [Planctomycetota bacterium]|jgi:hypothetical protein
MRIQTQLSLTAISLFVGLPCAALSEGETEAPISALLETLPEDVRVYNDHLVTLASPWMEGRVPGSRGMELAKEYSEYYYKEAGLEPPFDGSYRQPFELAARAKLLSQALSYGDGSHEFLAGEDFEMLSIGSGGTVEGPIVFVGYSMEKGPARSKYETYGDGDDLTGKIAVMFRFEPMDHKGKSLWGGKPWTARAGFSGKVRAAAKRGAAGILIIQTPGADDERVNELTSFTSAGRSVADVPVAMVTVEVGEMLLKEVSAPFSLMDMRVQADQDGGLYEAGGVITMNAEIDAKPLMAENVGAILHGQGALADELIVIGAHLDHLGMGSFGSRDRENAGKVLHPGADDNASGSAALLMLADRLHSDYEALPVGSDARSILFLSFSGEESGLNGSRHYVDNPIRGVDQHVLMINFDMIGRIENRRLSVSGAKTGEGLEDFVQPYFESSPLDIVQPENLSGASDHTPFMRKEIPVLFGIIADFHEDYHTPRDVSSKINRVGAVQTIDLFHKVALAAATRTERFAYKAPERRSRTRAASADAGGDEDKAEAAVAAAPSRGAIKVRFGIAPGSYEEGTGGVSVGSVTADSAAEDAGVEKGDVLTKWNGEDIADIGAWMGMLEKHSAGDKVQVTVLRGGEDKVLWVTLKGSGASDQ